MKQNQFSPGDSLNGQGSPKLKVGPLGPQYMDSVPYANNLTSQLYSHETIQATHKVDDKLKGHLDSKVSFCDLGVKSASLVIPLAGNDGIVNVKCEASQQNVVHAHLPGLFQFGTNARPITTDVSQFVLGSGLEVTDEADPAQNGISNIPIGGYDFLRVTDSNLVANLIGYVVVLKAVDTESNVANTTFWLPGVRNPYSFSLEDTTKYGYMFVFAAKPIRTASISGSNGTMTYTETIDDRDFELYWGDILSEGDFDISGPGFSLGEEVSVPGLRMVASNTNLRVEIQPVFGASDIIPGLALSVARDGARFK